MSDLPGDLLYTKDHEWLRREEDGSVTIGITDHAQSVRSVIWSTSSCRKLGRTLMMAVRWRSLNLLRLHLMSMHRSAAVLRPLMKTWPTDPEAINSRPLW